MSHSGFVLSQVLFSSIQSQSRPFVTQRRPARASSNVIANLRRPTSSKDDDDDDQGEDGQQTLLSRRVFSVTVAATGLFSLVQGYRLFASDRLKNTVFITTQRIAPFFSQRPQIQATKGTPIPVDGDFAKYYFDACASVAITSRIVSKVELAREEAEILRRSETGFFPKPATKPNVKLLTDPNVLNYVLYARIHAIAQHTSPASRVAFSRALGTLCFRYLQQIGESTNRPLPRPEASRTNPREHTSDWLLAVARILDTLVHLGWIAAYRLSEFDVSSESSWGADGRGELTVYCNRPVTLATAMLIGEEQFEEISPKPSSILYAVLTDYGLSDLTFEDYYLDNTYRFDPADYRPQEIVTQFNFSALTSSPTSKRPVGY